MKCTILSEINCNHKRKRKQVENRNRNNRNNTRISFPLNRQRREQQQHQQSKGKQQQQQLKSAHSQQIVGLKQCKSNHHHPLRIRTANRQPITRWKIENCEIEQYLINLDVHSEWISRVDFSISSEIYTR